MGGSGETSGMTEVGNGGNEEHEPSEKEEFQTELTVKEDLERAESEEIQLSGNNANGTTGDILSESDFEDDTVPGSTIGEFTDNEICEKG